MSSEWSDARLEELITVKHGFAFKGEYFTDQSTAHHLVTPGNFAIGGGFQLGKPKFYSGPVPPDYILNRGDVVVTMTDLSRGGDTLGFAGVVPETPGTVWLHNQRIGLVQVKPDAPVRAGYLHYMMRSAEYRHWVVSTATGSTVKHTSPGRICSYGFKLPPAAEQIGIEAILTALDDRIALLRETNATLEAIAQALFKSWFVDFDPVRAKQQGLAPAGMDEATSALFPDAFDASVLGVVPRGWTKTPIRDVVEGVYDGPHATPSEADEGPVFLGIKNLTGTALDLADIRHIAEADWKQWTRRVQPQACDIVFSYEATLGFFALIPPGLRCCLGRRLALIRPRLVDGAACFWFHQFTAAPFQELLAKHTIHGATVNRIALKEFPSYQVLNPPLLLQRAFDDIASALWRRIHANQAQAQSLTALRDSLLPRLISGQLRLPEAEALADEAA